MSTIGQLATKSARAYPNKLAVKFHERSITYTQLLERAHALTAFFQSRNLVKGDRIGVLMSNRLEHIELDVAVSLYGLIKVPLNYRLHPRELEYQIEDSDMRFLIGEQLLISLLQADLPVLYSGEAYEEVLEQFTGKAHINEVDENDTMAIMYTSGTTGNPKGVMLSHRNMVSGALSLAIACEVDFNDIIGHVAPLTHGANFLSHVAWLYGLTQVVYDKFEPEQFINLLEKDRISIIFLVPTMVNLMIQHEHFDPEKLATIKSINMAGSPIAAAKLQEALHKVGTKFVETYGQVEGPMCISIMPRQDLATRLDSCGRIGPFVDVKIVDDAGNECPVGEIGEITAKGPLVMQGYWNNEQATKETIRNGWLHTGDLGRLDENGYLFIVDRKKEVIISGGVNIYPREIEEVLNKHDYVKETCVIGIPDEKWGESVIAYVVPNGRGEVMQEALLQLCQNHLASFKKPKEIYIVEQLPKSSYGKILKRELVKLHAEVTK
ncbi:AMP-binding protein [Solibacillus sp. CAU 1738]|uniref:class I adenylate-forming enzyme family protein n=1 Tax=Solibacillus sp. CAU 1738 TaxID=3140363 RepID=UPI003261C600